MLQRAVSRRLPDFPWDRLVDLKARAAAHADGLVDLSIGTPVDPTPEVVQKALAAAADAPGYPTTQGTSELRESVGRWLSRRFGIDGIGVDNVVPAIGTKELISSLALHLGVGPGDTVVAPALAYPTYAVGALFAGADLVVSDSTAALGPAAPAMIWLNSPSNPTGRILPAAHLRKVVEWARERGTLVVSDECYLECAWTGEEPVSVLDDRVCGGSYDGILAIHSLSKRSNLAGYRAGFAVGDARVIAELLAVRKNLGPILPWPQQHASIAALDDDTHVDEQRERYAARRESLLAAVDRAGLRIDHSEGALYLWATRDEPCMDTVEWLAERGILVAPGDFYGTAGARHVRIAFTATDERVAAACARL